jgi:flagellar P-ring protein FlgI
MKRPAIFSMKNLFRRPLWLCASAVLLAAMARPALAWRLGDAVRMDNEVPNQLLGVGLVVGLNGTGDGGDFLPTMHPLEAMLKQLDDPVMLDKEMKNANNVAIVLLTIDVPAQGAHSGDTLDIKVSALAAKSLEKGNLVLVPMYAPQAGEGKKLVLASAHGLISLPDEKHPTQGVVKGGGVLIEDILPEEIKDGTFTFVLLPNWASHQMASAIADQINEYIGPNEKPIATALGPTSVQIVIPAAQRRNPTPFISDLMNLRLPDIPGPAKVVIDHASKTIVCTGEVEVSKALVSQGSLTVTIGEPDNPPGTKVPFVALDTKKAGDARLKDLQDALNLLKVSADDRIAIIEALYRAKALKADLEEVNEGNHDKK